MTVWEDLLEVILVGTVAGVGLSVAFAWTIRGVMNAGTARREGRTGPMALHAAVATLAGGLCAAAVVFAIYTMLHK